MGPDLLGIIGASAFVAAVLGVFALVDRIVCGAWDALLGSPASGLVAGVRAWAVAPGHEAEGSRPRSPFGSPPDEQGRLEPMDPVVTERVRVRRPRLSIVARQACGA